MPRDIHHTNYNMNLLIFNIFSTDFFRWIWKQLNYYFSPLSLWKMRWKHWIYSADIRKVPTVKILLTSTEWNLVFQFTFKYFFYHDNIWNVSSTFKHESVQLCDDFDVENTDLGDPRTIISAVELLLASILAFSIRFLEL